MFTKHCNASYSSPPKYYVLQYLIRGLKSGQQSITSGHTEHKTNKKWMFVIQSSVRAYSICNITEPLFSVVA